MVYSPSLKGAFLKTAVCPKRTELLHYVKETYGQEGRRSGGLRSHPSAAQAVIFTLYRSRQKHFHIMPKSTLWKAKPNPEDMLSLEISRAADASLSIEEKKSNLSEKAGMMGLPKAFLIEIEYFETTLTYLPHFQPLKPVNSRFNINPVVIRWSHWGKTLKLFETML